MFNLKQWKRRYQHNSDAAERNASMDSGWSLGVANQTEREAMILFREIVCELADMQTRAEDFFDRPELVQLQEAARFAIGKPERDASDFDPTASN